MINDCLSEIIGPFPVPPPRDKRERNDDPGQKRRGHRYSVHPSNHTIPIDYRDRRSVNYLDRSHLMPRPLAEVAYSMKLGDVLGADEKALIVLLYTHM